MESIEHKKKSNTLMDEYVLIHWLYAKTRFGWALKWEQRCILDKLCSLFFSLGRWKTEMTFGLSYFTAAVTCMRLGKCANMRFDALSSWNGKRNNWWTHIASMQEQFNPTQSCCKTLARRHHRHQQDMTVGKENPFEIIFSTKKKPEEFLIESIIKENI